ncbi:PH domain-containing protein [Sphaerisporangium sp. TRM90804]|uniref:PH domain-containing protein n=1 Tax=Sphaerisporangium sp. TRM90804 TaxID=3031113 RepID=UPI00244B374F|nr:PH domain-containing protein [Sphaerisporangium sp. TRM90804]MDH2428641.1 PH domain-containing protein [Sphaerisporangium sp. TRM90804]
MFDGETPPALPVVWRPRRARMLAYGFAAVMVVGSILLAVVLPPPFKVPDRIGVVVFGFAVAGILHMLGRLRVQADERGVTVVNAVRVHRYEWAEVLGVALPEGEPWPRLDLADGSSVGAMGIQGAEKERSRRAVAELRALIHHYGEAPDRR